MDKIIDQVSRYHVVNYLIPGLFFWLMIDKQLNLNLRDENIWVVIVIGYIAGMVISRIGSFFLEPLVKKIGLVKYVPKEQYIKAELKDKKIYELLTDSNMFRTMSAACIILLLGYFTEWILNRLQISSLARWIIGVTILFVIFIAAFILQTKKICSRVTANTDEGESND